MTRVTFPLVILDARREVLFADAGADALIAEGWLARVREGRLELIRSAEDRALRQAIDAVLPGGVAPSTAGDQCTPSTAGDREALPGCVVCRGPACDPAPWLLRVTAVACHGRRAAAVSIFDSAAGAAPDVRLLTRLFGLTGAEARVAACVAAGIEPARVAQQFGVGIATVRSHIARAFSKLGVRRQAELAQLLANPGLRATTDCRALCARGAGVFTPPR